MTITCEQFEAILQDLESRGALDEAVCQLAQLHAQTCQSCAARRAQFRSLAAGLRAMETSVAADGAPARVEAILRSTFLRQKWEAGRARAMRRWAAAGIAAALLLGAGVASRLLRKTAAPLGNARTESVARTIQPVQVSAAAGDSTDASDDNGGQGDDELSADFVPYPPGGTILPYENAQIVRVNLPGSALVAMGYPIDGDRVGERFTADLLVGEDGLPRAIRFPQ